MLGNFGSKLKYRHVVKGCNSRLDPIQAAILWVKLGHLDSWNDRRKKIAKTYHPGLHGIKGLQLPSIPHWAEPCWHLFVVRHPNRNGLQSFLNRAGIETLIHYPIPPYFSEAYAAEYHDRPNFRITEALSESVLSIPIGPHLSDKQVNYVIKTIRSFMPAKIWCLIIELPKKPVVDFLLQQDNIGKRWFKLCDYMMLRLL